MLKAVGSGRLREARKLLQRTMPMPSIFGRICDHPCEGGCLRADLGGSLVLALPACRAPRISQARDTG